MQTTARTKPRKQTFTGRHVASVLMTGAGSNKHTKHHAVGIDDPSVSYQPGDALGAHPENDPAVVERVLGLIGAKGDERLDPSGPTLVELLTTTYSLAAPSRRLLELMAERGASELGALLEPDRREDLKAYLNGPEPHDVLDALEEHPGIRVSPEELVSALRTLRPRLYSVASSLRAHPGEVHILVVSHRFTIRGREREGVTSSWLNARWPVDATAEVYLQNQQAHFGMPEDPSRPMIMIGPGTGLAPFRAFLEERRATGATGRNWLFFGEQHRATEFYYADELLAWERDGFLRLDLAFSRDQADRIYVQHRMRDAAADLWRWIDDGAEVYVCGDKARMAADVDHELHRIVRVEGGRTKEKAHEYVQQMRADKRYKRDVY